MGEIVGLGVEHLGDAGELGRFAGGRGAILAGDEDMDVAADQQGARSARGPWRP